MLRTVIAASLLLTALAVGSSPWSKYLASLTGKNRLDWKAACSSLGQTPSGYSSGTGGGKTTYHLTCDSNKIKVVCHGRPFTKCESAYKPPAVSSDTPPSGHYNVKATASGSGFTQKEVQTFLNIHNKMRCAVGAPPVKWDGALQRQAQAAQDKIGKFAHSDCYKLPIHAGENIATGTNVLNAAWMWFTEYLQSTDYEHGGETGHFSAMSWKGVTRIGCGVGRTGDGVIRCQYAGSPLPNMGGSYDSNLDKFYGNPADFKKCGLTAAEVKAKASLFVKWGILHPKGRMANNLGLYSVTKAIWANASPAAFYGACAFMGATAMVTVGVAIRRMRSTTPTQEDFLLVEAGQGLE